MDKLLKHHARLDVHDADGRTPYATTIWFENPQIADLIRQPDLLLNKST